MSKLKYDYNAGGDEIDEIKNNTNKIDDRNVKSNTSTINDSVDNDKKDINKSVNIDLNITNIFLWLFSNHFTFTSTVLIIGGIIGAIGYARSKNITIIPPEIIGLFSNQNPSVWPIIITSLGLIAIVISLYLMSNRFFASIKPIRDFYTQISRLNLKNAIYQIEEKIDEIQFYIKDNINNNIADSLKETTESTHKIFGILVTISNAVKGLPDVGRLKEMLSIRTKLLFSDIIQVTINTDYFSFLLIAPIAPMMAQDPSYNRIFSKKAFAEERLNASIELVKKNYIADVEKIIAAKLTCNQRAVIGQYLDDQLEVIHKLIVNISLLEGSDNAQHSTVDRPTIDMLLYNINKQISIMDVELTNIFNSVIFTDHIYTKRSTEKE